MIILIAPNSFKESLSSSQAAEIMGRACRRVFPRAEIILFPLADGGEGTIDVANRVMGGAFRTVRVRDPLGRTKTARWLKKGTTAVIEMAQASGLSLVEPERRNPLTTTSYGTGELIRDALKAGCRDITIGLGGSATNDAGAGALEALGVSFLGPGGTRFRYITGADIVRISRIDISGIMPEVARARFTILADCRNRFSGKEGASYVYAPQKGASAEMVRNLDKGLRNFARLVEKTVGKDIESAPGSGAAGGMGGGFHAFLDARILSGAETLMRLGMFEAQVKRTDLILTGEGRIDRQTFSGKTLGLLFHEAETRKIPLIAMAGSIDPAIRSRLQDAPLCAFSILPGPLDLPAALRDAERFLLDATEEALKAVRAGLSLKR